MKLEKLSRRERQIMDITFRLGAVTVNDVLNNLAEPPSYSTVRALLKVLENKGYLVHQQQGNSYLYKPTLNKEQASQSALKNLLNTFFAGSAEQAVSTLISMPEANLNEEQLERLSQLINKARKEGR